MWHNLVRKAGKLLRNLRFSAQFSSLSRFISIRIEVNSAPNFYISRSKYVNIHAIKHNFAA